MIWVREVAVLAALSASVIPSTSVFDGHHMTAILLFGCRDSSFLSWRCSRAQVDIPGLAVRTPVRSLISVWLSVKNQKKRVSWGALALTFAVASSKAVSGLGGSVVCIPHPDTGSEVMLHVGRGVGHNGCSFSLLRLVRAVTEGGKKSL